MFIESISVLDFRNLENQTIKLNPGINIFYGNNAQGKTSFLESIYVCGTGRSHRTNFDKELIRFSKSESHIKAVVRTKNSVDKVDVHLKLNEKKGIAVNSIPIKKLGDLFGIMLVVIFSPEDLRLVKDGPSIRRRFLDMELCQLNKIYYFKLQQYYKVLKQRNNLLKSISKNSSLMDTLDIWDKQLVEFGQDIFSFRIDFLKRLNLLAGNIYAKITKNDENFRIVYKPSVMAHDYYNKLMKNRERDIFLGSTNTGIHKDDILFYVNDVDVRVYGSQGQQRTCSLATKLAEIELVKEEKKETPILLLDDVFSELDILRQEYLIENISNIQTIITCTNITDILSKLSKKSNVFSVKNGLIAFENGDSML